MCYISAEGGGVFMSPAPMNYLHVKYIAPLLRLASELSEGRVGNRMCNQASSLGSPYRFHALAGTVKVMVH